MLNHPKLNILSKSLFLISTVSIALGTTLTNPQTAKAAAVRSGFNDNVLAANDDFFTDLVPIGFEVNLGGIVTDSLYVNNNGNVTFDEQLPTYTPFSLLETDRQIIAPFFADVDTRGANSSEVTYGTGTVDGRNAFGVNWVDVGYFSERDSSLNSFQLVLIERSDVQTGAFDIEFNYDRILWESGEASGSDANGMGGDSARAGFAYGVDADRVSFELEGSAINGALIDGGVNALVSDRLNRDVDGGYLFTARNGDIIVAPVEPPLDPPVNPPVDESTTTPEPASILALLSFACFGLWQKRQ